jgi:hypothetical protein
MLANVLNSTRATRTSVQIVRAFINLRQMLVANKDLERQLSELEQKYDNQFAMVFDAIRQLMSPRKKKAGEIGFHVKPR